MWVLEFLIRKKECTNVMFLALNIFFTSVPLFIQRVVEKHFEKLSEADQKVITFHALINEIFDKSILQ